MCPMSESDLSHLLSVEQAVSILNALPVSPRLVDLELLSAEGCVLAQDLSSDRDYPPFDRSLMDGYAVRCADITTVPQSLRVAGQIAAGQVATKNVEPGQAVAIMTGAPLPPGADGVVPVEHTRPGLTPGTAEILQPARPGENIARKGHDCEHGKVILPRGTRLGPAQIGVAATVGATWVQIYARPRVAVLSTGDELVQFDQEPGPGRIRNANSVMIGTLLDRLGCEVHDLGIAPDQPNVIRASLEKMSDFDALFVSGGMSMGTHDYVPRLLIEMGVSLHVTKLRIRPGKPFIVGTRASSFVFGLPGNPVSAFVCTLRLASIILARLSGAATPALRRAVSTRPLPANGPREFYLPAIMSADCSAFEPLPWKGSADVFTLAKANALVIRPENAQAAAAGETHEYLEIP